jgi:hypothetical protein
MYYHIFSQRDTTLYELFPTRNTGRDSIIELTKIACGSLYEGNSYGVNYNSRILLQFDLSEISSSIVAGNIPTSSRYFLNLRAATSVELPYQYTLYAYPVSQSWDTGVGTYGATPPIIDGASWTYRVNNGNTQTAWSASGGTYYTSSVASQSFSYAEPDVRMDVTSIVNAWLSNSIPNNGLIIKRNDADEQSSDILGSLKFFSTDTNTIYIPKLEIGWVDAINTGSVTEINDDNMVVYFKNLQASYKEASRVKLKIGVRPAYPTLTYSTSSNYLINYALPTSSYYSVKDTVTEETIIPFDDNYTKISSDANGSYFNLRLNTFLPERFYRLIIKTVQDGGDRTLIHDNGYYFKIVR